MIIVNDPHSLEGCIQFLNDCTFIGFDLECPLDPYRDTLYVLSLHGKHKHFDSITFVMDLTNEDFKREVLLAIKPLMENPSILKVAHNAVFDWKHLYHYGIYTAPVYCTMIAEQLVESGLRASGFGLDDVAERRLGIKVDKTVRNNFIDRPDGLPITQEELEYAAGDAYYLELIYEQQIRDIEKQRMLPVLQQECEAIPVTAKMEYGGIHINEAKLREAQPLVQKIIDSARIKLQDVIIDEGIADEITFSRDGYVVVNLDSPPQKLAVFNKLDIGVRSLGKKELSDWDAQWAKKHKKRVSTAQEEDDFSIGFAHPFLREHAIHTAASKLQGTYIEGLLSRINPITGKLHPSYKQCGASSTGRFSSSSPKQYWASA